MTDMHVDDLVAPVLAAAPKFLNALEGLGFKPIAAAATVPQNKSAPNIERKASLALVSAIPHFLDVRKLYVELAKVHAALGPVAIDPWQIDIFEPQTRFAVDLFNLSRVAIEETITLNESIRDNRPDLNEEDYPRPEPFMGIGSVWIKPAWVIKADASKQNKKFKREAVVREFRRFQQNVEKMAA